MFTVYVPVASNGSFMEKRERSDFYGRRGQYFGMVDRLLVLGILRL